jgi:hypothetical protein
MDAYIFVVVFEELFFYRVKRSVCIFIVTLHVKS